jgi:glutathione peroxidase-family protein
MQSKYATLMATRNTGAYEGQVLLIVNASPANGLHTAIWDWNAVRQFHVRGFEVLGFPTIGLVIRNPEMQRDQEFLQPQLRRRFSLFAKIEVNGEHTSAVSISQTEHPACWHRSHQVNRKFLLMVTANGATLSPTENPKIWQAT